jgi:hypothetical protein
MATLLFAAAVLATWWAVGAWRTVASIRNRRGYVAVGVRIGQVIVLLISGFITYQVVPAMRETIGLIRGIVSASERYKIVVDPTKPHVVILEGEIAWGSAKALSDLLMKNSSLTLLELNSYGGSIVEAEKIATLVENRRLATNVRAVCISACTLAYVCGSTRTANRGARFGFHRLSGGRLTSEAIVERLSARYAEVLLSHGVDKRFIDTALSVNSPQYWVPGMRDLVMSRYVHRFVD